MSLIEPVNPQLSLQKQCELIGLSRASYYRHCETREACKGTDEELAMMRLIDEEFTKHPFLGSRKMRDTLRLEGYQINRKRVQRLMRKMGLQSVAPKPNTSLANKAHKVYPYLLKNVDITHVNHVWSTDITYIRLPHGFVYLVAVMDWYSRQVLSWEVSNTMDSDFCVNALERACRLYGKPLIFNTDQGSQFTSETFTSVLKSQGIQISMDGKGRATDNIFIERLWRSVKYEEVYLNEYSSVKELKQRLGQYFHYYNHERPHQSLDGQVPSSVYNAVEQKAA